MKHLDIGIMVGAVIIAITAFMFNYVGPTTPYFIAVMSILVGLRLIVPASERINMNVIIAVAGAIFVGDLFLRRNGFDEGFPALAVGAVILAFWWFVETCIAGFNFNKATVGEFSYQVGSVYSVIAATAYLHDHPTQYEAIWIIALIGSVVVTRIVYLIVTNTYPKRPDALDESKCALICLFVPAWLFGPLLTNMTFILQNHYAKWSLIGLAVLTGLIIVYKRSVDMPIPDYNAAAEEYDHGPSAS